jgi:propanol-preferring alcohol dehydrogenase
MPFAVASQTHYNIPKTQKAVVIAQTGKPLEVRNDWPVVQPDELKPGEVLVRLAYTGVCHTDLHIWAGDIPMPLPLPLVGGHEGTGYIAAIGKDSKTRLQVGDAVGVKWTASSCLDCEDCRKGYEPMCQGQRVHGVMVVC